MSTAECESRVLWQPYKCLLWLNFKCTILFEAPERTTRVVLSYPNLIRFVYLLAHLFYLVRVTL
jgi:hypothetical protein